MHGSFSSEMVNDNDNDNDNDKDNDNNNNNNNNMLQFGDEKKETWKRMTLGKSRKKYLANGKKNTGSRSYYQTETGALEKAVS